MVDTETERIRTANVYNHMEHWIKNGLERCQLMTNDYDIERLRIAAHPDKMNLLHRLL